MRNLRTTQQRDSPPGWLRDSVDVMILAAVLLAMTLAALL
jgi:hypothetical protein